MTTQQQDQEHEGRTAKAFAALTNQQQEPEPSRDAIVGGIEWYVWEGVENCQCARCGSSCIFVDCWNCFHGYVEKDFGDDVVPELHDMLCEWCAGAGGSWHCISGHEWCKANPLPDREHIVSTALERGE